MILITEEELEGMCCEPNENMNSCKVEAIVSLDDRGQILLPKNVRDKAKIKPGDKLAVVTWENNDEVDCISLIRTEDLVELVKNMLNPMMKEFTND